MLKRQSALDVSREVSNRISRIAIKSMLKTLVINNEASSKITNLDILANNVSSLIKSSNCIYTDCNSTNFVETSNPTSCSFEGLAIKSIKNLQALFPILLPESLTWLV